MVYDTIIVGAGIAGVSAALVLSKQEKVLVVEAGEAASGASGVAAGLFSPMPALRGRPVWAYHEVLDAFNEQLDATDGHHLFDNRGVLRPGYNEQQAEYFKASSAMLPGEADWLSAEASKEQYPYAYAPYGSMFVRKGGAVNLAAYVHHLAQAAGHQGIDIHTYTQVTQWGEQDTEAFLDIETPGGDQERLRAKRVILCWGRTFILHPSTAQLNLHQIKGQTIRVTRPDSLDHFIPISSKGYVISQPDHIAIGSSFEHQFTTDAASGAINQELLQRAQHVIPALAPSRIIDTQVGFRVTVPGLRKPVAGPIPGHNRIFAFGGFGSKGLLYAPYLATRLPDYLTTPSLIPSELQVRVKSS